jgi:nicotinic acid mononucleotide adenylyltransferase
MVPGSFDPMTVAHAALAGSVGAELALLVWSSATLPKERGPGGGAAPPLLEPEDRLASMQAWCAPRPWAQVAICSHGLLADQAEATAAAFPGARLVFGIGSDKVLQLLDPGWYEDRDADLGRLFARAEVAWALRSGDEEPIRAALEREPRWRGRIRRLDLPADVAEISSRAVRRAVRRGEDVAASVPPEVLPFVRAAAGR